MNKQLERDLQSFIQSLKSSQLANVIAHYELLTKSDSNKNFTKKGMNYECEVSFKNQSAKGYGRNQQQSLSNATKNLLSVMIGKNIDIDKITQSLKYKNGFSQQQGIKKQMSMNDKELSLILDDLSIIEANSKIDQDESGLAEKNQNCGCVFYEMHQYQQSQIKHLQARINLLSEENQLLKKMLLCSTGSVNRAQIQLIEKQNDPMNANSSHHDKKILL